MRILLLAEHDNSRLNSATDRAVTAAAQLGGEIHVLVAGRNARAAAEQASRLESVARVLLAEAEALEHLLAEPTAALLAGLAESYDVLLAPATANGKNIMPRAAALLDVMQVSDIIEVIDPDTFKRPIYAGNAVQTVRSRDAKKVLTVRTSAFDLAGSGADAEIETIDVPDLPTPSAYLHAEIADSDRPELESARVVISGGRGLGSKERFEEVILPFADQLSAGVGASRAAVDAGYAPNDWQVGQTGKIVAPDLYIAVGISGAIQHLAGMKDSRVIVAINKDEEAPIFQIADYGFVADLFDAIPAIQAAMQQ